MSDGKSVTTNQSRFRDRVGEGVPDVNKIWKIAEGYYLALDEWLGVLAELWKVVGKPVEVDRLDVYRKVLADVPLGLLVVAVRRVIRESTFNVVSPPGAVWEAVRRELGYPRDMGAAIEQWMDRLCEEVMLMGTIIYSGVEFEAGLE